jgi:hypothetical protein
MQFLTDYVIKNINSNYQLVNIINHYNFIISILNFCTVDQKYLLIEQLKIQCGMTFFTNFREYCIKKLGMKSDLVNYLE